MLENASCNSNVLSPWATPVYHSSKKSTICLVLDCRLLNKSINAVHNGNSIISYYPLPNIMDLLARLQTV